LLRKLGGKIIMGYYSNEEPEEKKVKIKVNFDPTPIRHLAVQCPDCENWFHGADIYKEHCSFKYDIFWNKCKCPKCGNEFKVAADSDLDEARFPEFYKECLQKKEVWE
jgi:ribosomal protein S27E